MDRNIKLGLVLNAKGNFYSELSFTGREALPPLISSSYTTSDAGVISWVSHTEKQFIAAFQSDQIISLKDLNLQFHFIVQPSGAGLGTQSRDIDSILKNM